MFSYFMLIMYEKVACKEVIVLFFFGFLFRMVFMKESKNSGLVSR